MLIIRAQQEARLKEGARSAFLGRVEEHVLAKRLDRLAKLDSGDLRVFVERNWETARGCGLHSERGLCVFLEAVCRFGDGFPNSHDWASALLRGASFEDHKIAQLCEHIELLKSGRHPGSEGNGARPTVA